MLHDHFRFDGVLGKRDGADAYMDDMKKMKFKYSIKMVFTNGDDIGMLLDFTTKVKTLTSFSWYHVDGGRVSLWAA